MPKARPTHFAADPLATSADATEPTAHCCTKAMDANCRCCGRDCERPRSVTRACECGNLSLRIRCSSLVSICEEVLGFASTSDEHPELEEPDH